MPGFIFFDGETANNFKNRFKTFRLPFGRRRLAKGDADFPALLRRIRRSGEGKQIPPRENMKSGKSVLN